MSSLLCVVTVPTEIEESRLHAMTCACGGAAFASEPKKSRKRRYSCFGSARKTIDHSCDSNDVELQLQRSSEPAGGSYGTSGTSDVGQTVNVCQQYQQHRDGTHHWEYPCHSGAVRFETPDKLPNEEQDNNNNNNNENNENASVELNITRCASLERVLREIICKLEIPGVFWSMDLEQRMLQARFTIALDEKYERLIATLHEWGIGERVGTSLSAINCLDTRSCPYPYKVRSCGIESTWNRFMDSVRCRLNVHQVVRQVRQDATVTFDFLVLLISAAVLACFGLVENSQLFLSSSMLISPLMGPIIAGVFGTVIKDYKLCWLGIRNEMFGIACATIVGLIFGIVVCFAGHFFVISSGLTQEILSRCETHALSVGVFTALASGAAGAIAVLGGNIGSLVGVAISASLLPPAVNSGLLWALAMCAPFLSDQNEMMRNLIKQKIYSNNQSVELICYASISMLVTLLNIACVWIMGVIVLRVKEIAPSIRKTNEKFWKHDIKIARQTGFDAETLNAIENYDGQKGYAPNSYLIDISNAQYQHTWSPANKSPEYEALCQQRNYHTVHGFETLCPSTQKSGRGSSAFPDRESATASISIMELFAKGPVDISPTTSYENTDLSKSKHDFLTETTITPYSGNDYDFCIRVADKWTQKRNYWNIVRRRLDEIRFLTFDVSVQTDLSFLAEWRKRISRQSENQSEATAELPRTSSSEEVKVLWELLRTWSSEKSDVSIEELTMEQPIEQVPDMQGGEQPKELSSLQPSQPSQMANADQLSKSSLEPEKRKSRYEIVKVLTEPLEMSRMSVCGPAQAQSNDQTLHHPIEEYPVQQQPAVATEIAVDDYADMKPSTSTSPTAPSIVITLNIGMSPTEPTQSSAMTIQPTASQLPPGSTQATQEKSTQSEVAVLRLKQDDDDGDNKDDTSANEYDA